MHKPSKPENAEHRAAAPSSLVTGSRLEPEREAATMPHAAPRGFLLLMMPTAFPSADLALRHMVHPISGPDHRHTFAGPCLISEAMED